MILVLFEVQNTVKNACGAISLRTFWTCKVFCSLTFPAAQTELELTELRGEGGRKSRCCSNIWEKKGYLKFTNGARKISCVMTCMLNVPLVQKLVQEISLNFTNVCPSVRHVVVLKQSFSSFLAGIRSWDVDLQCCDLDQQLQLFITRHSAHFSSEVRGQCDYGAHRASGPVMTEHS